jgi:hypothetical protein
MDGWNPAPKGTEFTVTQLQAREFKTGLTVDLEAFMVELLSHPPGGANGHCPTTTNR